VRRTIEGFHQDDVGDWVAELSCLHGQHVRHQPPFRDRGWVIDASTREDGIGTDLECPLCDRAELPDDLVVARTVGPFDATTLPKGLTRDHRVADHTWGLLRVAAGEVRFTMASLAGRDTVMAAGATQPIPPGVAHSVQLGDGAVITVEFLVRGARPAAPHGHS